MKNLILTLSLCTCTTALADSSVVYGPNGQTWQIETQRSVKPWEAYQAGAELGARIPSRSSAIVKGLEDASDNFETYRMHRQLEDIKDAVEGWNYQRNSEGTRQLQEATRELNEELKKKKQLDEQINQWVEKFMAEQRLRDSKK